MYDLIGDIHGHADALEALLQKLGYTAINGSYQHPERKVIFLGDFIDRGPKVKETLRTVKAMVDAGHALAVMGNHEFNFLCYHRKLEDGSFLREHNEDNDRQVEKTLESLGEDQQETQHWLNWFYTLPLWLERDEFRVVHACWKPEVMARLYVRLPDQKLSPDLLLEAGSKGLELYELIEIALKGVEVKLKEPFQDHGGKWRDEARVRWWLNPKGLYKKNYIFDYPAEDGPLSQELQAGWYYSDDVPVFIGHYWLEGDFALQASHVCCVDYSIGKPKDKTPNPRLVAYRWSGGGLNLDDFCFVDSVSL